MLGAFMTVRLPRPRGNGEGWDWGCGMKKKASKDFFFVNKKEAKKTFVTLDRAGGTAGGKG
jgi:hypothetical protein